MYIIWCFILTTTSYSYLSSKCGCFFNSRFILINCLLRIRGTATQGDILILGHLFSFAALDQFSSVSSVQSLSHVWLFATPWTTPHEPQHARPPCPSPTPGVYPNPCPLSRWCHPIISSSSPPSPSPPALSPLLLLPSVFLSIRVFSNEWVLHIRWPKYWSFSFNISPSNEHPGLISFRTDRLDLLAVQGTLKSLLQYHISKASILLC